MSFFYEIFLGLLQDSYGNLFAFVWHRIVSKILENFSWSIFDYLLSLTEEWIWTASHNFRWRRDYMIVLHDRTTSIQMQLTLKWIRLAFWHLFNFCWKTFTILKMEYYSINMIQVNEKPLKPLKLIVLFCMGFKEWSKLRLTGIQRGLGVPTINHLFAPLKGEAVWAVSSFILSR